MIETFDLGDIVEMKKQHPCGSKEFEVIRLGADIKIIVNPCYIKNVAVKSKGGENDEKVRNYIYITPII